MLKNHSNRSKVMI